MVAAREHSLGILGGMGPVAGALLAYRLAQMTPAKRDQDHLRVILRNDPRIPDRSSAHTTGTASPLPAMLEGIQELDRLGVSHIAIPCNTAHLWFDQMKSASNAELLHIVEAVCHDLESAVLPSHKVGVLGTEATLRSGLYHRTLNEAGFTVMELEASDLKAGCAHAIALVKANRHLEALDPVVHCIRDLARRGASAVVLGCTELPLAVPHSMRESLGIPVIDSIDALARSVLRHLR